MADSSLYSPTSEGYAELPELPDKRNEDGKSYYNPPRIGRSEAYETFIDPISNGRRGGFDVHIYYDQHDAEQATLARELWKRIRREFPELRIYQVWDKPVGPHTIAMFEVNVFNPEQFGAFVAWLVMRRGPLSALVHPNTGDDERDHTQLATWLGEKIPLDLNVFKRMKDEKARLEKLKAAQVP